MSTYLLEQISAHIFRFENDGGVDVRKFEPNLNTIKPMIRDLRKLYKKNSDWFEVPKFAVKVY